MKKTLLPALPVLALLTLAACNNQQDAPKESAPKAETEAPATTEPTAEDTAKKEAEEKAAAEAAAAAKAAEEEAAKAKKAQEDAALKLEAERQELERLKAELAEKQAEFDKLQDGSTEATEETKSEAQKQLEEVQNAITGVRDTIKALEGLAN